MLWEAKDGKAQLHDSETRGWAISEQAQQSLGFGPDVIHITPSADFNNAFHHTVVDEQVAAINTEPEMMLQVQQWELDNKRKIKAIDVTSSVHRDTTPTVTMSTVAQLTLN